MESWWLLFVMNRFVFSLRFKFCPCRLCSFKDPNYAIFKGVVTVPPIFHMMAATFPKLRTMSSIIPVSLLIDHCECLRVEYHAVVQAGHNLIALTLAPGHGVTQTVGSDIDKGAHIAFGMVARLWSFTREPVRVLDYNLWIFVESC